MKKVTKFWHSFCHFWKKRKDRISTTNISAIWQPSFSYFSIKDRHTSCYVSWLKNHQIWANSGCSLCDGILFLRNSRWNIWLLLSLVLSIQIHQLLLRLSENYSRIKLTNISFSAWLSRISSMGTYHSLYFINYLVHFENFHYFSQLRSYDLPQSVLWHHGYCIDWASESQ